MIEQCVEKGCKYKKKLWTFDRHYALFWNNNSDCNNVTYYPCVNWTFTRL